MSPSPDVLVLTETWLHSGISDAEIGLQNYCIYRSDRYSQFNALKGGGILIAIKKNLKSQFLFAHNSIEEMFIKVSMHYYSIVFGCFYSPKVISEYYAHHVSSVEAIIDHPYLILSWLITLTIYA